MPCAWVLGQDLFVKATDRRGRPLNMLARTEDKHDIAEHDAWGFRG